MFYRTHSSLLRYSEESWLHAPSHKAPTPFKKLKPPIQGISKTLSKNTNSNKLNTAICVDAQYILSHPTLQSPTSQRSWSKPTLLCKEMAPFKPRNPWEPQNALTPSSRFAGLKAAYDQPALKEPPHLKKHVTIDL